MIKHYCQLFFQCRKYHKSQFLLVGVDSSTIRDEQSIAGLPGTFAPIINHPGISTPNNHVPFIEVQDRTYVFVDMFNGTVYGERLRLQPGHAFPIWMRQRHQGNYVYVRMPNDVGLAAKLKHLPNQESERGKMQAMLLKNGVINLAVLQPIVDKFPSNLQTCVYVGLENGIILSGILAPFL